MSRRARYTVRKTFGASFKRPAHSGLTQLNHELWLKLIREKSFQEIFGLEG